MMEKVFKPENLSQLEDALEERQRPDRRQQADSKPPAELNENRRKADRRGNKTH
jgi:hypothetical protein